MIYPQTGWCGWLLSPALDSPIKKLLTIGATQMNITTIGIDLAKNIFQIHGVTDEEAVAFNKPLRRAQMLPFFAKLDPCLIGMEACSSAHYWARELTALGHQVKLMPPAYVKPYVKRGKSDAADAEAICEAVIRPTMRFVAIKSAEQQAILCQHRAREVMVGQRTQLSNTIRGLVGEFGITIRRGLESIRHFARDIETDNKPDLPGVAQGVIASLCQQLLYLRQPYQTLADYPRHWSRKCVCPCGDHR